jgi:heme/copper-type cytochrome/quinol oxidase subunit 2
MRVLLAMCVIVAVSVFAAMFFAICNARRSGNTAARFRQSVAAELVWAAIPCLMIIAAATPAVALIVASPPAAATQSTAPHPPAGP